MTVVGEWVRNSPQAADVGFLQPLLKKSELKNQARENPA